MLTGPLGRLYVGEGNAVGNDGIPVNVTLVGRDVDTLGLIPLLKVPSALSDSGTKDTTGEEKCRYQSFDGEQHCCCESVHDSPLAFIADRAPGAIGIGGIHFKARTPSSRSGGSTCPTQLRICRKMR